MNDNWKREVRDYVNITLGILLFTFAVTVFILPYQIVTGGISGVGALVFYATGFPLQYTYFIINAVLIVATLRILGWRFLTKTIYATIVLTVFMELEQQIVEMPNGEFYKLLGEGQDFMSLVIGCMLTGTALAVIFLNNGSTGGTDIVAAAVNKHHPITLGKVIIVIDCLIVLSSLMVGTLGPIEIRLQKVVFGACTIVIECLMLDFVMYLQRQSVQFLIFSRKHEQIADAIMKATDHTCTLLDGHGWYTKEPVKVICVLVRKTESVQIFRLIKQIDPRAFVSQSSVIGVYGESFDQIKVKIKAKNEDGSDN